MDVDSQDAIALEGFIDVAIAVARPAVAAVSDDDDSQDRQNTNR